MAEFYYLWDLHFFTSYNTLGIKFSESACV